MPVDFSAVKHRRRTIEVDIDGDVLNVEYDPTQWNDEMIQAEQQLMTEGRIYAATAKSLDRLVVEWDAVGENGPLPPVEETFLEIGPYHCDRIYEAIWRDCLPENHARIKQLTTRIDGAMTQNQETKVSPSGSGKKTTGKKRGHANAN